MNRIDPIKPLNITLISHSDVVGGAAVAMKRILTTLTQRGHNVRMLVFTKVGDDPKVINVGSQPTRRLYKFGIERLRILLSNGFNRNDAFKVSIANVGLNLVDEPAIRDADIIMLGWINQGLLSLEQIRKLSATGKPIVWVMHDLWNVTGACHHPYECRRFEQMCGHCPYFGHGKHERDLSRSTWWRKKQLYDHADIDFVAVSHFVADCAAASQLMANRRVRVIPNTFFPDIFNPSRARNNSYSLPRDKHIIVFSAARIDHAIKGLDIAIEAFNHLFDSDPTLTNRCEAVFVGDLRNPAALDALRFPYRHIGMVHERTVLAEIYAAADVILSTSLYETFGLTLLEGLASGATPVTFGRGGQTDIVRHKVNGYIARYRDPLDIAEGIKWAIDARLDRDAQHRDALDHFSPELITDCYETLFAEILHRRQQQPQQQMTFDEIDRKIREAAADNYPLN